MMAKLVVLKKGSAGVSYELKAETTTVGRMDDNTFQIDEASISSHHCEVFMKGGKFSVKDLGSTNGTYVNGDKVTESPLTPGKSVMLGEVEVRLDTEESEKKRAAEQKQSRTSPKGVNLKNVKFEPHQVSIDEKAFTKKNDKTAKYFIIGGGFLVTLIVALLLYALFKTA